MATTIRSTDLDFANIKNSLKTYFQQQSEFSDYDFTASGLDNLLDVLAYNTHFNGLVANFALNESFISTSQLRSSIVSHAEALGYRSRSVTSSVATVNLTITVPSGDPTPSSLTIPSGFTFNSTVNGTTFTFQTEEPFAATPETSGTDTLYRFKASNNLSTSTNTAQDTIFNIPIKEGVSSTRNFYVDAFNEVQVYVIPEETIDTTSLTVNVYESPEDEIADTYSDIQDLTRLLPTTKAYNIQETPNGYFEIIFGNDTGVVPSAGNRIEVSFLKSSGELSNAASSFSPSSTIDVGGTNQTLTVTTVNASAGGAAKQSIDSIRQLAPLMYSTQQRLVTADDYRTQILTKFAATVRDVNAYGGENAPTPKYGVVYVSLKFFDEISDESKTSVKNDIINNLTDNLSVLSVSTEFIDPTNVFLELTTTYNLNPSLTNQTSSAIENSITTTINNFFTTNLQTFNKTFRRSLLLTEIDALDDAILNSKIDTKMQMRIGLTTDPVLTVGTSKDYILKFPTTIADPDDVNFTITSTTFTFNNKRCTIKNKLESNILQIISSDGIEVDNIGSYNGSTGTVSITGFNPTSVTSNLLKVSVVPANQSTVRPLLNYILDIDTALSSVTTNIDYENIRVSL